MLLIDQIFLWKHLFNILIQRTINKIIVWEIDSWMHKCQNYVCLNLYLLDILNRKNTFVYIVWNVHLINNFCANLLIDINIIKSECISTDISLQKVIIKNCHNMLIDLSIMLWKNNTQWIVWLTVKIVISSQFIHQVTVKTNNQSLSKNKDLIFWSFYLDILQLYCWCKHHFYSYSKWSVYCCDTIMSYTFKCDVRIWRKRMLYCQHWEHQSYYT